METELFIEGLPADISATLASLLTMALDDLKDFASRQTTFSKTVILPGTARNNQLLGNIFDVGSSNSYNSAQSNVGLNFNPSVSARCIVFQDFVQAFKGTLRLMEIVIDRGRVEYEVALAGELTLLNVALSSKLLQDLDFAAYDHSYSVANITDSWDNPGGTGYYYPLIDYGAYSTNKHDWDVKTFRPALYVKEYLDKMFTAASFRYDAPLFSTSRFKNLIVPHNQSKFQRLSAYLLNVFSLSNQHYTSSTTYQVPFATHSIMQDFTANGTSTTFTYSGASAFNGTVGLSVSGTYTKTATGNKFIVSLYKNGLPVAQDEFGTGLSSGSFGVNLSVPMTLVSGNFVQAFISFDGGGTWDLMYFSAVLSAKPSAGAYVDIQVNDGVAMNDMVPKNIKQIDFLTSISKAVQPVPVGGQVRRHTWFTLQALRGLLLSEQSWTAWTGPTSSTASQPIRHDPNERNQREDLRVQVQGRQ
jgi:hypothetical protein